MSPYRTLAGPWPAPVSYYSDLRFAKWGMTTVRSARNQFGVRQFGRWRSNGARGGTLRRKRIWRGGGDYAYWCRQGGLGFYLAVPARISAGGVFFFYFSPLATSATAGGCVGEMC